MVLGGLSGEQGWIFLKLGDVLFLALFDLYGIVIASGTQQVHR